MKVYGIPVDAEWLIKLLINFGLKILDQIVKGEQLTKLQAKFVRTTYYLLKEWGTWYAEQTDTPHDDQAVDAAIRLCEDTAEEGHFALPSVPPLA